MKLTAILLATLLEASKATVVSYTDGGGVRQDVAVSDVNKPGLAGLLYAVFSSATANLRGAESFAVYDEADPLNSFDNLLATNGNQGYCQRWGSQGGDLCREEKMLAVCSGYDGSYYLPYKSEAEVASKCLEEPKCKGFTWDTKRAKGKLKSGISSVYNNNRRWQCFKKLESAIMACPNHSDSRCSTDGSCACYDPRELRINYPQKDGVNLIRNVITLCYACVMPDYTPTGILQCKNNLDCDINNSKCAVVRADYNGQDNPPSNTETMCIPNTGAAIGKPCYTSTLCASGSCMYDKCGNDPSGDRCSATTPCPNNLCCSEYGFCGSTYAFCGPGCQSGPCDPRGVSQDFNVMKTL